MWLAYFGAAATAPLSNELTFSGAITKRAVYELTAALDQRPSAKLVINSYGGEEEAALELSRYIRQKRLDVDVVGVCMSACAQYVLPSARRVRITSGSFVAFHISSYAVHNWASRRNVQHARQHALSSETERAAIQTATLLADRRAALQMLETSLVAISPQCFRRGVHGRSELRTTAAFFVPTRIQLEKLGFVVPEDWPASLQDVARYSGKYIRNGVIFAFGSPKSKLDDLPAPEPCGADEN